METCRNIWGDTSARPPLSHLRSYASNQIPLELLWWVAGNMRWAGRMRAVLESIFDWGPRAPLRLWFTRTACAEVNIKGAAYACRSFGGGVSAEAEGSERRLCKSGGV